MISLREDIVAAVNKKDKGGQLVFKVENSEVVTETRRAEQSDQERTQQRYQGGPHLRNEREQGARRLQSNRELMREYTDARKEQRMERQKQASRTGARKNSQESRGKKARAASSRRKHRTRASTQTARIRAQRQPEEGESSR